MARAPDVGDVIEAVGMPEADIYTLNLSRAIWRKVGDAPAWGNDTPQDVSVKSLFTDESGKIEMKPGYHGRLVRLRGVVQNATSPDGNGIRLNLSDEGFDISVEFGFGGTDAAESFRGCKVEVTGVCVMEVESRRVAPTAGACAQDARLLPRRTQELHLGLAKPGTRRTGHGQGAAKSPRAPRRAGKTDAINRTEAVSIAMRKQLVPQ